MRAILAAIITTIAAIAGCDPVPKAIDVYVWEYDLPAHGGPVIDVDPPQRLNVRMAVFDPADGGAGVRCEHMGGHFDGVDCFDVDY